LDRARSYAESAVSATAAALRNVSLAQLNRRDLGHVSSLGSYWDTLGWVAFAEGKMEISERYVSAAWQLDGSAEEGDHLGQIYEKRGNKAEAAHFYGLALSAERPEPETRDHLAALVGPDKADAIVEKYKSEQQQSRTYHVANPGKLEGKADFFVLLSRESSDTPKVEGVSQVSGEVKLKPMSEALRSVKFNQPFPDDSRAKILRRGSLTCRPSDDCSFVLTLPSQVRSLD
jgi:hypothetical protein